MPFYMDIIKETDKSGSTLESLLFWIQGVGKESQRLRIEKDGSLHLLDRDVEEEEAMEAMGLGCSYSYVWYKKLLDSQKGIFKKANDMNDVEMIEFAIAASFDFHESEEEMLRDAIAFRSTDAAIAYIKAGADVNAANGEPLIKATGLGLIEIVKALLDAGADQSVNDFEALRLATQSTFPHKLDIARLLLDYCDRSKIGRAVSMVAGWSSGRDFCREIQEKHIGIEKEGDYFILGTCKDRKLFILSKDTAHLTATSTIRLKIHDYVSWLYDIYDNGELILLAASTIDDITAVRFALNAGVSAQQLNNTPLRHAAREGNVEIVKLLLKHGADVHAEKDSAMKLAALNGNTETLRVLLDAGADPNADNGFALTEAARYKQRVTFDMLVKAGAKTEDILFDVLSAL